jgi:putative phosphoesterase
MNYKIGLISDTHGHLHPDAFRLFAGVDCILHGGDVVNLDILSELESIAPTYAVVGNCDSIWSDVPEEQHLDLPCGRVVVLHSHLVEDSQRTPQGLASLFVAESPALILYGHTHRRLQQQVGNTWIVNPGPAGKARLQDVPTLMLATWHKAVNTWTFETHLLTW